MSKAKHIARLIDSGGQVVTTALVNVIDGSPTALDTLNEIAAALGNGVVAITNGGTGATTAVGARDNLGVEIGVDIPSNTGTGASGTWNISVAGNAATADSTPVLSTTNFSISEVGGKLVVKYGATTIVSISSTGEIIAANNVTAYGTP